jgi:DNA-binding NarL/FixJ family response regulator
MGAIQVMTVDDCAVTRHVMRLLLAPEIDMEIVAEAASLYEAMMELEAHRIDVVILDLNLPDVSGPALIERLQDRVSGIILISANARDLASAMEVGHVAGIEKSRILGDRAILISAIHEAALHRPMRPQRLIRRPESRLN